MTVRAKILLHVRFMKDGLSLQVDNLLSTFPINRL